MDVQINRRMDGWTGYINERMDGWTCSVTHHQWPHVENCACSVSHGQWLSILVVLSTVCSLSHG